jgi:glycosyltransferase involved in cell wall biosynthesis
MKYRVSFFAPDRHIQYDASTPDRVGVGGGIMARIRLARALAEQGHEVSMIANCPRRCRIDNVLYVPLEEANSIQADIAVPVTSGGDLDLSPFLDLDVEASLVVAWVHGPYRIRGLRRIDPDFIYMPSNFILDEVTGGWGIPPNKTFVTYNGATTLPEEALDKGKFRRDPLRVVYASHPSKGLEAALEVHRLLMAMNPSYELHIYGSPELWGQQDTGHRPIEEGVVYHGMVPQYIVLQALQRANVSLSLQARDEGLPLIGLESMRSGCLLIASRVGGYTDIIENGRNGFIIDGDHTRQGTLARTAELIHYLVQHPLYADFVRREAQGIVWDWPTMARSWSGHWEWALASSSRMDRFLLPPGVSQCHRCGGRFLPLADGYHCVGCGRYTLDLDR